MADTVLLLATQSNLGVIRVLSAYFLSSYYDVWDSINDLCPEKASSYISRKYNGFGIGPKSTQCGFRLLYSLAEPLVPATSSLRSWNNGQ